MRKYKLVVIGNWKNSVYGAELKRKYKNFENLVLLDPIHDRYMLNLIRGNAYVYIHGADCDLSDHSLAEAMRQGLPVIALDIPGNRMATENKALYYTTAENLKEIIENTRIAELKEIGLLMKEISVRTFRETDMTEKYQHFFQKILNDKSV